MIGLGAVAEARCIHVGRKATANDELHQSRQPGETGTLMQPALAASDQPGRMQSQGSIKES